MIDFELSEMQDTVRQMVHWLAETEIRPIALEADRNHKIPDECGHLTRLSHRQAD